MQSAATTKAHDLNNADRHAIIDATGAKETSRPKSSRRNPMAIRNTSHTGKARRPSQCRPYQCRPSRYPPQARRARQEHHGSARHHNRTPHTDSLQPRGLPHPGRMRPALSRLLKPMRHRAHTKRPAHGPGRPTAHHRRHHPHSPRAKQIVRPIPRTSRTRCRHTSSTARCSPRGKRASGRAASRR